MSSAYPFTDHSYDVVVVGAGNSGAEAALELFERRVKELAELLA